MRTQDAGRRNDNAPPDIGGGRGGSAPAGRSIPLTARDCTSGYRVATPCRGSRRPHPPAPSPSLRACAMHRSEDGIYRIYEIYSSIDPQRVDFGGNDYPELTMATLATMASQKETPYQPVMRFPFLHFAIPTVGSAFAPPTATGSPPLAGVHGDLTPRLPLHVERGSTESTESTKSTLAWTPTVGSAFAPPTATGSPPVGTGYCWR